MVTIPTSPSTPRPSTAASTSMATSCPAWAMPGTASSGPSSRRQPIVSGAGSARTRIHRRQLAAIMLVAAVVVPVFNVVTSRPTVAEAVQGLLDAVLISILVGGYLLFVRDGVL